MNNQDNLNDGQSAVSLGQKLGLFISALPASDEVKAEMVQAALLMKEEELVEFVTMLEVEYAKFKTQDIDQEFAKNAAAIKDKFAAKKEALDKKTLSALSDLENELDNL